MSIATLREASRKKAWLMLFIILELVVNLFVPVNYLSRVQAAGSAQLLTNGAILDTEGNSVVTLPNYGPDYFHFYNWSPDGNKVAYSLGKGFGIVNTDGSGQRELVNGSLGGAFAWSPDSTHIAFTNGSFQNGGSTKIFKAEGLGM